jgi:hypothetical protein
LGCSEADIQKKNRQHGIVEAAGEQKSKPEKEMPVPVCVGGGGFLNACGGWHERKRRVSTEILKAKLTESPQVGDENETEAILWSIQISKW